MAQNNPYIVIKFGGKSVASLLCWKTIASITQKHLDAGFRPLIVCSAISRISDKLDALLKHALEGDYQSILNDIRERHEVLADELSLDSDKILASSFEALARLVMGVSLVKEVSPSVRAQVMALGELMLTRLGYAYLESQGFDISWQDARHLLTTLDNHHVSEQANYLTAKCDYRPDKKLQNTLDSQPSSVLITQGFVAANAKGETVLLGRGGSDTSAAYYAAKLSAVRCEIWTDVPGIYTANPHQIPEARRLKTLAYDEAQEIASMGAKVLHPHCIYPLHQQNIPLYVGYTLDPDRSGTLISSEGRYAEVPIKAILTKNGILLISIETVRMWQQVGFLADVFACFKRHGLSIDLVSTSESNVTVSLDFNSHSKQHNLIDRLLDDLNIFCKASVIGPCASVSLVGHNIRGILHKLGEAFEVFEEQHIHLISQAANDLNLTFVVDEDQVERLAQKLHALLIEQYGISDYIDKSWQEEFSQTKAQEVAFWWQAKRDALLGLAEERSPAFVYDRASLRESAKALLQLTAVDQIFYAIKANDHPEVLNVFHELGLGFECVSQGEMTHIFKLFPNIDPGRIMFTPNFAPKEEYQQAFEKKVVVNLDNLHPLQHWPEIFEHQDIFLRIDSGEGAGHHKYVCTGGSESKFGIASPQFDELLILLKKSNVNVVGLHCHSGSGILQPDIWQKTAAFLVDLLDRFPKVRTLNLGGGLGVIEKPGQKALDLARLNDLLLQIKESAPTLQFWMEPGRFLVSTAGVLLAKVTQVKQKGEVHFIGLETGMNSLIRPALYGSYHMIVNLTRLDEPGTQLANVVGPICESGDTLGLSRFLPETQEGDVFLIANCGSYGRVMSSHYNKREPAEEVVI